MKALIFVSFLFIHTGLFSQRIKKTTFEEISVENSGKRFDSILIIGAGSTATRIFLDDLVTRLTEKLDTKNVVTEYIYLGESNKMISDFLDTLNNADYKVIMVFYPGEQASLYTKNHIGVNFVPFGYPYLLGPARKDRLNYEEEFLIVLYENNQRKKDFWKASLKVHNDPGKRRHAKKISNWILTCFKKNNYL
ncbi:MAG: hypothetical protein JST63_06870 [Bacteroidetes bacterium]|nr:hypothetical protein [Bacteroidota bacterium]